ncbi:MAG: adenine deaminase [Candidatus Pelethousia sp.]|nr:adenine deaminase [Candidatus Pelethousia sp.]
MRTFEEIRDTVRAGLGQLACDLKLENVQLVNVFSGEIYPTDIYIRGGRVVSICPDAGLEAKVTIPCGRRFAVPGFIDTHMHFETTMLSPEALAAVVVPRGTTTLCADLMEIANVAGEDGIKAMLDSIDRLPYRMLIEVSSRVPTAPGLETTGAILGSAEVARIMDWPESVSLGEIDPSKILFGKEEYLHKIADTLARRKIVNGHAIGRLGQELNVYASSGVSDDHETVNGEEMLARLRVGMRVLVREGSTERNADELLRYALDAGVPLDGLCFCTDDKHPTEIREEGHINYIVRRAIQLGMRPMDAIRIATINAARHFRLDDEIGSITPGRKADILLVDSLEEMEPAAVFYEGRAVAQEGGLLVECPVREYPAWIMDTVHLKNPITAAAFALPTKAAGPKAKVWAIGLIDRQIINHRLLAEVPVVEGALRQDVEADLLKLAIVERYGVNGNVGVGFVKGFGLQRGAIAFSTSHDHHNIAVIGTNDADMALAVNEVARLHGGLAVASDGCVRAGMRLPIGGLMSEKGAEAVMTELDAVNRAAAELGCPLPAPFMTLSFISLPTVPELGLTDMGLVDVLAHKIISLEVEEPQA